MKKDWKKFWNTMNLENYYNYNYIDPSLPIILRQKRGMVLDSGCGVGRLIKPLTENKFDVVGIDKEKNSIAIAKRTTKHKKFVVGDALNPPFKNNVFNMIISVAMMEYFDEKELNRFFNKSDEILKDSGKLFVFTTNKYNLLYLIKRIIFSMIFKKIEFNIFQYPYLFKKFTYSDLKNNAKNYFDEMKGGYNGSNCLLFLFKPFHYFCKVFFIDKYALIRKLKFLDKLGLDFFGVFVYIECIKK